MTRSRSLASAPLGALRAFEAVARLGSFKLAAAELAVTPAAVSHQIAVLERYLGAQLFKRLNRAIAPTRRGASLALTMTELFDRLSEALDTAKIAGQERRLTLFVSVVPSLAAKWLAPRLHRFRKHSPEIDLNVSASDALVDLLRDPGVDVALRYGAGPYRDPGIHAERLWPPGELFPVCSPILLEGDPPLRSPADLGRHVLMWSAMPPGGMPPAATDRGWPAWLAAAGANTTDVLRAASRAPAFSSTQLALEAAAAGEGIVLAPEILVADDIASGRLVRPFDTAILDPFCFWLLFRADRAREPRIDAWRRWIRDEAGRSTAETPYRLLAQRR
jgi:LysR family transcriptional regulator, glycine cleavage system transcriptional activator